MALIQPKTGFHTGSSGGNLDGITADYIIPVLHSGKDVTIVAADTTAGLYDACVAAKNYQNTTSVLCWRRTDQRKNGGFDFDALANNFSLSPEQNAELHWQAYQQEIPPELVQYKDILELIVLNEIRGQNTNEPVYDDLHIGEYLGRFALHYRTLTDWRLLFFGFASGEPDIDVWEQPSMLNFLRLCGERPHDTGIAAHEYSYTISDILHGYPYKIGRYQFLHDICDDNGIPRPRIVISEWGWALDDAPAVPKAMADIETVYREYAKHPNIAGGAIWWLGPDFGGIANKIQPLIKPLGEYIITTNYDVEIDTPQPPDNGQGGDMTQKVRYSYDIELPRAPRVQNEQPVLYRLVAMEPDGAGSWKLVPGLGSQKEIVVSADKNYRFVLQFEVLEDGDENPNPPSVVTLPKGALGVDVSAHQGVFSWDTAVSNGVKFAIIRSSNGLGTVTTDANGRDLQLKRNAEELTRLGIPWAVYHFLQPNQSITQQAALVNGILAELDIWKTFPVPGLINGRLLPAVFVDVEDGMITTGQVKEFMDALTMTAGIYTGKGIWDGIAAGESVWWSDVFLWCAAYGVNDGKLPNWTSPGLPRGWYAIDIWQYTSLGGNELGMVSDGLDLNSAGPYAPDITTPPPTGKTIDVAPYFVPEGQYGAKIVMQTGNSTQPMQLEKRANDVILRKGDGNWIDGTKYQDSEQWRVVNGQVQKGIDTSDAGNGGRDGYDLAWAQWIPQIVEVGKTYHSTPTVRRFDRANCGQTTSTGQANDYLHIKALLPTWTSPANAAITLNDVLVIEWRSGTADLNVPPNETYYFAKKIGYCGWGSHFVQEITEGQQPLVGKLDCGM